MNPDDTQDVRVRCAVANGYVLQERLTFNGNQIWLKDGTPYAILCAPIDGCEFLPNFPESTDAALELVEALRAEGYAWRGGSSHNDELQRAWFTLKDGTRHAGVAETLPLAICRAFLKCKGLEP